MRALVVGASGGLGAAFVAKLVGDSRYSQVIVWTRSAAVASGEKIVAHSIDLRDESTIEAAAASLDEVDLAIVATGLLHDRHLKPEKSWRSLTPSDTLAGDHGVAAFSTLDGGYLGSSPSAW